jgi:hypothetical protein
MSLALIVGFILLMLFYVNLLPRDIGISGGRFDMIIVSF